MLKDLLESKKCFKLVCGAGNENSKDIEELIKIYYAAGCRFFDLSMNTEIINIAKKTAPNAYFSISTGIKGDPHLNKVKINSSTCKRCEKCKIICPQKAIDENLKVKADTCIGCLKCFKVCKHNSIEIYEKKELLEDILPPILEHTPDCIELHAIGEDELEVNQKWQYISKNFNGIMSICLDRSKLSNDKIITRIKRLIKERRPYTTIVQADGAPMSGGEDDFKTTLQSVAMADIIQKADLPIYLLLSGGTNSKTFELAKQCNILPHGIAIGSYARKIIKTSSSFDEQVKIAQNLIKSTYN